MRRRWRRLRRRWRRCVLRLALGRWRRLRPRRGLVRFRLWPTGFRPGRFRTIRLCSRRMIVRRRWLRIVRLSWTVSLRLPGRRTVRLWVIVLWRRRTVVLWCRRGAIRLCCRRTIRFCQSGRGLIGSLLSGRPVHWLVGGRLSRTDRIRLITGWIAGTARSGRCRFAGRRHLDHRTRGCSGWTQALQFARRDRLPRMRCQSLLLFCKWNRRWRRHFLRNHLAVHYCRRWCRYVTRG